MEASGTLFSKTLGALLGGNPSFSQASRLHRSRQKPLLENKPLTVPFATHFSKRFPALPLKLFKVIGHSMEPTFKEGDLVLVNRWAKPKVGDVVVANDIQRDILLLKRIKEVSRYQSFKLSGDNPVHFKEKYIKREEILGKVIG